MGIGVSTALLMADGTLRGCGYNGSRLLGLSQGGNIEAFTKIPITSTSKIKQVALSESHMLVLFEDGTVQACGVNSYGQLGIGNTNTAFSFTPVSINNVKQVGVGSHFSIFLMNDGTVKSCGLNNFGQLGAGSSVSTRSTPQPIAGGYSDIKSIAVAFQHTVLVRLNGNVLGFGYNLNNQLTSAQGTGSAVWTPTDLGVYNVKTAYCGERITFIVLNDGTVQVVGGNTTGELGTGSSASANVFTNVTGLIDPKFMAVGSSFALALMNDGSIKASGNNGSGQLGNNMTSKLVFTDVPEIRNVRAIAVGDNHSIFMMEDGTVKGSGNNSYKQLGFTGASTNIKPAVTLTLNAHKHLVRKSGEELLYTVDKTLAAGIKGVTNVTDLNFNGGMERMGELTDNVTVGSETFKPVNKIGKNFMMYSKLFRKGAVAGWV